MAGRRREPIGPTLYTVVEAAFILRRADATIRKWIKDGKLKVTRFGNEIRISETELRRILYGK